MIFRSSSCSFTSEILRRRAASVDRAAWKAVATEGKRKPWQQTQQEQSMLRNSQYPWNCKIGGGSTFVSFLPRPLLSCITTTTTIQYDHTNASQHPKFGTSPPPLTFIPEITTYLSRHAKTPQRLIHKQNIIIFFRYAMKRPTIINMSLNALRDIPKVQDITTGDRPAESGSKNSQFREEVAMQDLLVFIKLVTEGRGKVRNREGKGGREAGKPQGRPEREETLPIPLQVCESVDLLLRRYLLFRAEERPDGPRTRPKLAHDRSSNLRTLLRTNKENQSHPQEQEDETAPFRSMATQQWDRERLVARNQELQGEAGELRERLKEKNAVIGKLLGKETQLRRKYNEQLNRLLRNRNIYNISANFEREEQEGEGRNALNVAGRHIADSHSPPKDEEQRTSAHCMSQQTPASKTLPKSESEYMKDGRPRLSRAKPKLHPFRPSKHTPSLYPTPATQFLRTANKSLPTECISHRLDMAREKQGQEEQRPTFELYINQLESTALCRHEAEPKKALGGRMRDEQFQVMQLNGFYNEDTLKEIDDKIKI